MVIPALYTDHIDDTHLTEIVSAVLDTHSPNAIGNAPWGGEGDEVSASFAVAYSSRYLFLKYYVTERSTQAHYNRPNEPVYNDSCVEFFIAFDNDERYYNLEFNCAGNALIQYGAGRHDRVFVPAALLKQIKHQTSIRSTGEGIAWSLTLCIPVSVFSYHKGNALLQGNARVNVYKCGDQLPQPHYLCWGNIEAEQPDFHLSNFFKPVTFGTQPVIPV